MRGIKKVFFLFFILFICFLFLAFHRYLVGFLADKGSNSKEFFNIVLVGAAGSGKGTQADLIKNKLKLFPVSAGEVMRQYRKNHTDDYSSIITECIDHGKLVPVEITNEIMGKHIDDNVFCNNCRFNGVIFDGYPRQMEQLSFLDEYLKSRDSQINAVIYIDVPVEKLVERLSGRFSCAKCGELYHRKYTPTKVSGVCDKCGHTEFSIRADDANEEAIKTRFRIFEESTKSVLENYRARGLVIKIDGTKTPEKISKDIISALKKVKKSNAVAKKQKSSSRD